VEIKCKLDATEVFIADFIACSTCFGHHYAHHQELKSIIQCLLPVVFVLWFSSFWSGVELRVMCPVCSSILQTEHITLSSTQDQKLENHSILQTGHITLSSTPDQKLENHSTKYHRQQLLYNTLELLMMGIVVPETS